jgi:hypothetical protein
MANQRIGNRLGVPAANVASGAQRTNMNGSNTSQLGEHPITNLDSITAMRARLQAISAGTYTNAVLDTMTYNDMTYAIRLNDNPDTIKDL